MVKNRSTSATSTLPTKTRSQCLLIAELAAEAERYQDVIDEIKYIAECLDPHLTLDERNLLSVAYKNRTNGLRSSWRIVDTLEKMEASRKNHHPKRVSLIQSEREKIEAELAIACREIAVLLEKYILPAARDGEEIVFYSKMIGDYNRYLAEFSPRRDRERYATASLNAYTSAYKQAVSSLEAIHPTRLGLALNFAVFYHDVRQSPERACHLAKNAFDEAVGLMNSNTSNSIADSLMILQLLKDDLVSWSQEMENSNHNDRYS